MRISDWSSDVCSSDLAEGVPSSALGPVCHSRVAADANGQVQPGAVRLDNAGFDIAEIGVDDEIADALGIDRAADLAEQLLIIAGEVLAPRIGDQRGDAGAVAQPDPQIARHAIGIAGHDEIAEASLRRTGRVDRPRGETAPAAGR